MRFGAFVLSNSAKWSERFVEFPKIQPFIEVHLASFGARKSSAFGWKLFLGDREGLNPNRIIALQCLRNKKKSQIALAQ